MFDCLVIGGGPAGLTAALYLARFRRDVCVIDAGHSRAALIPESHNYPGFVGISGKALLDRLREQVERYEPQIQKATVEHLRRAEDDSFLAKASSGEIRSRTVILATGIVDECPAVEGFSPDGYVGPIRFCPICDGYEAMGKSVGILGNLTTAAAMARFMRTYTKHVFLFATDGPVQEHQRMELEREGIILVPSPERIRRVGNQVVVIADKFEHPIDVLYPALGCKVNSALCSYTRRCFG